MLWVWYLLIFFLGSAVGSFINVLIDRTIAGTDWVRGRSHCDNCRKTLAWYDLIPIFSYMAYRGRSRCCRRPLTPRHPIVEGIVGALFLWWAIMGSFFFQLATRPLVYIQPLFWLGVGIVLLILGITDWLYGVVLMPVLWVGVFWVALYRLVLMAAGSYHLPDLVGALVVALGTAVFIQALRWVTKGRGMGDGDPYLMFLAGIIVGWPRALVVLLFAFVAGAGVGITLLATGRRQRSDTLPFGPFLVAGVIVALIWGGPFLRTMYGW